MAETHLTISDVRQWADAIFDALEQAGIERLPLDQEQYWQVWFEDAFDFEKKPEIGVGALSDDISDLRKEAEGYRAGRDALVPWHSLSHLAGILNFVAASTAGVIVFREGETP